MSETEKTAKSITALSIPDAALVLSKASGKKVDVVLLKADIAAGAPLNPDGTMNLVTYAAWLVKELADCGD